MSANMAKRVPGHTTISSPNSKFSAGSLIISDCKQTVIVIEPAMNVLAVVLCVVLQELASYP